MACDHVRGFGAVGVEDCGAPAREGIAVYEAADRLHESGFIDIQQLAECLEEIESIESQREQFGVWKVTGRESVSARIDEFIADADEQIVYMTVDELLTDERLDRLRAAADRGVEIY